jgi:uracil-DNA glycosylase
MAVVRSLKANHQLGLFVDDALGVPEPFIGRGSIRLIILGQDPTVEREASREAVKTVLNLDRPGSLRQHVQKICAALGLELEEHVYATNVCKNFFIKRPLTVAGIELLETSARKWLPVLNEELAMFPHAVVVSLGEPVLKLLIHSEHHHGMKHYWGHHREWRTGAVKPMRAVRLDESTINRQFFPVVHQPSMQQKFYARQFAAYMRFIREQIGVKISDC